MRNKDIKKALDGYFAVLSSYQPVYSTYAGGIYEMELTRAAIHCFATHCSKLKPEVIGNAAPALGRVLQYKPNPLMDTKKYLYRLATIYMTDNNAIIAPLTEFDEIKGFYPLAVGKTTLVDYSGQTYVRYDMGGGEYFAVELARCGILNQFQYTSELWGESNLCLRPTLELIDAQNKGIINGIKNSAVIRFIAKLANSLKPKDMKGEQERLNEINLGMSNSGGVFLIDQKYEDVKQIDSKPYIINPSQMEYIKQNVFTYFGTNEHILQNQFTPDEWNAYYEGKIEPFALEIGLVHTNMTFTEREKSFGNQIFFSSNRLQYASIQDKINYVVQMGDRGRTNINEDREVFNLPPIPGGDRHFIRGEYRPVDSYEGTELSADPLPNGNETLPNGNAEPLDKSGRGGIIEKRGWVTIKGQHVYIGEEGGTDASAKGKNKFVKGFRNKQALNNHWQNGRTHQKEYADDGITTKEQYEARALELAESACSDTILGYKNAQNEIVRYDTEKNDFVKGNPNKCIKTMFKPEYEKVKAGDKDAGLRYFKKLMKKEGVKE